MYLYYKVLMVLIRIKLFLSKKNVINNEKWYTRWIVSNETHSSTMLAEINESLEYKPLISIVLPVYNVDDVYLKECIESVRNQLYQHWQLCIADDCSTFPHVRKTLEYYCDMDDRIQVAYRDKNGHISASTNTAISLANGEFITFLDNDDLLSPLALYEIVKTINGKENQVDFLYSDEDKLLNGKRIRPFYKKKWNPKLLLHFNYICHIAVYRRGLIEELGGLREGFEGVQDWDLALRVLKKTDRVTHIPKILYHWRIIDSSTASSERAKPYVKKMKKKVIKSYKENYWRRG
ncbi:glycosyltransferase [Paenibacillus sp. LHD-38]|uniref:glycosyltransferase family 2 protein n=1 Tax=Paenibacillus sp. LHD-38 TaxID=3072143 RepID=UPI00280C8A26|nr:glycosyltransferase [Paenibacillus sp. LHD-38]MDQ8733035.1 glycosyltransferase [Paenibacillus sp. LHD-38]